MREHHASPVLSHTAARTRTYLIPRLLLTMSDQQSSRQVPPYGRLTELKHIDRWGGTGNDIRCGPNEPTSSSFFLPMGFFLLNDDREGCVGRTGKQNVSGSWEYWLYGKLTCYLLLSILRGNLPGLRFCGKAVF
jgi:hypothetical protein